MSAHGPDPNEIIVRPSASAPATHAGYTRSYPAGYVPELPDQAEEGGGLLAYWRILQRRRGTVVLIAFLGVLTAVLFTLPQTPLYQAKTTLEVQTLRESASLEERVTGTQSASNEVISDMQTQIKLIQSKSVLERAGEKVKATMPADAKPPESKVAAWREALNLSEPEQKDPREAMIQAAVKTVKARASGQTRVVELTVDAPDPKFAAEMANAIANEFIDANIEARWKMTQRTADWLSKQLDEMKIKLERSEDALQQYARAVGLVFTSDRKENITEEKLRQVQAELSKAQADRMAKQSRYETAKNSSPEALPDVLSDSSLREYQSKLTDLRRQEAELVQTFKPEFSKVKRVQAQIETVEAALQRERKAIVDRIRNDYEEALRREKLLATDYGSQTKVVTTDAEKAIQYNILKREVDTNRQLYDSMLQRVKESSIASAMKASNVRVVDAATAPKRPYKPQLPVNAAVGLFAGTFLGIAFVVVREREDRTLQQPGDTPFYLQVPELGVIPAGDSAKKRVYYVRRKRLPAGEAAEGETKSMLALSARTAQPERVELATCVNKSSTLAESFRATLTSILFSGENGSRPQMLVVTSANPGEGKTTVASNLAVAVAEIGRRVLLVDADLRKPRAHDIFGLNNDHGLSDLLRDRAVDPERLEQAIHEVGTVPGLSVLPSGKATSAAANLLHSPVLPELLQKMRTRFDMVLIDTPPMLQMPDARVAGRLADAVVLVVRADKTTRDAAVAAKERLAEDKTRVLGTILNDWDPKKAGTGYYGYYASYAHYALKEYKTHYSHEGGRER